MFDDGLPPGSAPPGSMPLGSILRMAASGYYPPVDNGAPWPTGLPVGVPNPAAIPVPQGNLLQAANTALVPLQEERAGTTKVDVLQKHLMELKSKDPTHVIIARGISRLGPRSQELLTNHYSKYGKVVRVLVTRSKVKPAGGGRPQTRIRPGSLGFVLMESAACVERILAAGAEQVVEGRRIRLERFQQIARSSDNNSESGSSAKSGRTPPQSRFEAERVPDGLPPGGERTYQSSEEPHRGFEPTGASTLQAPSASGLHAWLPQTLPDAPQVEFDLSRPRLAGDNYNQHLLQSCELVTKLSRIMQIIRNTSSLAVFTGQQCVEVVTISRWAQQQLQVLLNQCEQQMNAISQETLGEVMQQMQDRVQGLTEHYAQMCSMMAEGGGMDMDIPMPCGPHMGKGPPSSPRSNFSAVSEKSGAHDAPVHWGQRQVAVDPAEQQPPTRAAPVPAWGNSGAATAVRSHPVPAQVLVPPPAPQRAVPTNDGSGAPQFMQSAHAASPPQYVQASQSVQPPGAQAMGTQSLGMHLNQLQDEDPCCVFIARKISGMGFNSQDILRMHYSKYGQVSRVLVVNSKVKPFRSSCSVPRIRPGSLGFIVMVEAESVKRILAEGKDQIVAGMQISVEPFEHIVKPQVKPHGPRATSAADSTSTATGGDTTGPGSRDGSNGSEQGSGSSGSGCNGSEKGSEGSDKSGRGAREKGQRSSENALLEKDSKGAETDSQTAENDSSEAGSGTEPATQNAGY